MRPDDRNGPRDAQTSEGLDTGGLAPMSRSVSHGPATREPVYSGNRRIQKFTADGAFVSTWGTAGSGNGQFSDPHDVSVDEFGGVYVVANTRGGGASDRRPCGAPPSTQAPIVAISSSLSDGSLRYSPMLRSMCQGGISRRVTFCFIARAQGRASS